MRKKDPPSANRKRRSGKARLTVLEKQIQEVNDKNFAVLDNQVKDQMIQEIEKAAAEGDS